MTFFPVGHVANAIFGLPLSLVSEGVDTISRPLRPGGPCGPPGPGGPLGPGAPGRPRGPRGPRGPPGSLRTWFGLKSAHSSEPFLTFEATTAFFLNCFVPTLLAGSTIAAYPVPPMAMRSARHATIRAGEGRRPNRLIAVLRRSLALIRADVSHRLATATLVRDDFVSRSSGGQTIASGEASGAQPVDTHHSWDRQLNQWLGNPLLVTVVAAVLGGLLIPHITRQWQNHEKALEIKTGLVTEMSESASRTVMSGRFIAAGLLEEAALDPSAGQRAWNDGYQAWTTSSASIGAKLEAYFAGSDLGAEWRSFANVVTDFFDLSAAPSAGRRAEVREILLYPELPKNLRLSARDRRALETSNSSAAFHSAYDALGRGLLQRRDELVQRVLDGSVSGF
jgi:hypothetical protein